MGTSSGLIHHYFASMDDVLAAAFEEAAGADLAQTRARRCRPATAPAERLSTFFASYVAHRRVPRLSDVARRMGRGQPASGAGGDLASVERGLATTDRHHASSMASLKARSSCDDPDAAAWRVLSLLDGLSLQLAAHPGVIEIGIVMDWAMTALETEVGLPAGTLARPHAATGEL